jgi:hypothetical protein
MFTLSTDYHGFVQLPYDLIKSYTYGMYIYYKRHHYRSVNSLFLSGCHFAVPLYFSFNFNCLAMHNLSSQLHRHHPCLNTIHTFCPSKCCSIHTIFVHVAFCYAVRNMYWNSVCINVMYSLHFGEAFKREKCSVCLVICDKWTSCFQ